MITVPLALTEEEYAALLTFLPDEQGDNTFPVRMIELTPTIQTLWQHGWLKAFYVKDRELWRCAITPAGYELLKQVAKSSGEGIPLVTPKQPKFLAIYTSLNMVEHLRRAILFHFDSWRHVCDWRVNTVEFNPMPGGIYVIGVDDLKNFTASHTTDGLHVYVGVVIDNKVSIEFDRLPRYLEGDGISSTVDLLRLLYFAIQTDAFWEREVLGR